MEAVTRIMANVTVLIRMLPLMNDNSFLSLARSANRISLKQTVPRYQIKPLYTHLNEPNFQDFDGVTLFLLHRVEGCLLQD